eukprot:CAMPEP_0114555394 /NCGR_PEP_ID=MMETSP0114-20121206/8726_1 /TAXON_ID=31324 /ORGANISM="Goniomonas sp, Strain m" /LENGTH=559 /DNA_ID=CAMNT_0001740517 /DNA_START=42 /DNA_END=1718 /DNA_ORIENTATION=+
MDSVLQEVQSRPYSLQPLSLDVLRSVWDSLCGLVTRTLVSGKGIGVPSFGVWTFRVEVVDLGNYKKTLKTPVFVLSEKFSRTYNLRSKKQLASGGVPVNMLNALTIASMSGCSRDEVQAAMKDIFLYAGDIARSGRVVRLDFNGVGQFLCSGGNAEFIFSDAFANTFEAAGHGSKAPLRRPATAPHRGRMSGGEIEWGSGPLRPGEMPRNNNSRPGTAQSARGQRSRPGTASQKASPSGDYGQGQGSPVMPAAVLSQQQPVPPSLPSPSRPSTSGSARGGRTSTLPGSVGEHASLCNCKHCIVRANYNRQIEEKYAMRGLEERLDRQLIALAKSQNSDSQARETEDEERKRRARQEIEQFNAIAAKDCRANQIGSLTDGFGDVFDRKIDEQRSVMNKAEIREILSNQVALKREQKEREREEEQKMWKVNSSLLKSNLESEKAQARAERRAAAQTRRSDLENQIKNKRSILPAAASSAVWLAIPRATAIDLQAKRAAQKKLQEATLGFAQQKEADREREREEEREQVANEIRRLQESINRTEHERREQDAAKKRKARDAW